MNERILKIRTSILKLSKRYYLEHDPAEPCDEMNFQLVHCVSKVRNEEPFIDDVTGVQIEDCYYLRRCVEMYSWKETRHERRTKDEKGNERVTVSYHYH